MQLLATYQLYALGNQKSIFVTYYKNIAMPVFATLCFKLLLQTLAIFRLECVVCPFEKFPHISKHFDSDLRVDLKLCLRPSWIKW